MEENQNNNQNQEEETVTMTKTDYAKAIQSAEDKLRTSYSAKIKDLESKLPHEKTDEEKDYEQRLAALEAKEKKIALQESLANKKLDNSFADFLKDDVDIQPEYATDAGEFWALANYDRFKGSRKANCT